MIELTVHRDDPSTFSDVIAKIDGITGVDSIHMQTKTGEPVRGHVSSIPFVRSRRLNQLCWVYELNMSLGKVIIEEYPDDHSLVISAPDDAYAEFRLVFS